MPTTTLYTAHILPARSFSRTVTSPVDIKNAAFKSLSAFLRASEKGGLLKLKHAHCSVGRASRCSIPDTQKYCYASNSSHSWGGRREETTCEGA
ncbi:hypothetical protein EDB83DRAFT_2391826 [Lactarius deliciosus]|nr:hypothetical protein EDB83DRAFT_2391826 [Lactarius deliciosus]